MIRSKPWIVTAPVILLLGWLSGWLSNSDYQNYWFDTLYLPWFMPPGWAFGVAWTILYILMGISVGLVIASDRLGKRPALVLFVIQLALNLAWSPVFFGAHQIRTALIVIFVLTGTLVLTILFFWRVRRIAALLLLPYLLWLLFATELNLTILRLNL